MDEYWLEDYLDDYTGFQDHLTSCSDIIGKARVGLALKGYHFSVDEWLVDGSNEIELLRRARMLHELLDSMILKRGKSSTQRWWRNKFIRFEPQDHFRTSVPIVFSQYGDELIFEAFLERKRPLSYIAKIWRAAKRPL